VVSCRVPPVPSVSSCIQFRPPSCPRVSSRILLVPRMRDTFVISRRLTGALTLYAAVGLAALSRR